MNLRCWIHHPPTTWIAACFIIALPLHLWAGAALDASYAASRFPVPYYVAQLSFDAAQLKDWYATLAELGTMEQYLRTQRLDFLFIATVLALHFSGLLLVSRLFPADSGWRPALVRCAVLSMLAPLADAAENGLSYVMLADPNGFAEAWAYAYSSCAALKFAMFVFAYGAAAVGIAAAVCLAVARLCRRRAPG
jgi:hypothetical protein